MVTSRPLALPVPDMDQMGRTTYFSLAYYGRRLLDGEARNSKDNDLPAGLRASQYHFSKEQLSIKKTARWRVDDLFYK